MTFLEGFSEDFEKEFSDKEQKHFIYCEISIDLKSGWQKKKKKYDVTY